MAVWLSGSLMKYCLGGRVDTAIRVRGSRVSTINSSIVKAGPQQLLHTSNCQLSHSITTVNSWRSLHSRQLPSTAAFWWATTTVYLQGDQVPQQVLHSTATAGHSLFITALPPFCSFFIAITSLRLLLYS
jgi:hypothetical protein